MAHNFIVGNQANLYATDKVVYIGPTIDGFSAGAGYEPNSDGLKEGYGNNTEASITSAALSASPVASDIGTLRKNTVDAMLQYGLESDGVAYTTSAGILYGAPVAYSGPSTALGTATHFGYDNLEVYQIGGQATYAGLTVAANIKGGQVEDGYAFKPKGARNALAYMIGAKYVIGPYVVGALYFNSQSSGAFVPDEIVTLPTNGMKTTIARTLTEYGIAVGGNYVISPDLNLFLQYMYDHRQQHGNVALSLTNIKGDTQGQIIGTGVTVVW
jgi:hypothetical protein